MKLVRAIGVLESNYVILTMKFTFTSIFLNLHLQSVDFGCLWRVKIMTNQEAIKLLIEYRQPHYYKNTPCGIVGGAYDLAIEALEKQIAKKPNIVGVSIFSTYSCPNCESMVGDLHKKANCCPDCGQKLDWSGHK